MPPIGPLGGRHFNPSVPWSMYCTYSVSKASWSHISDLYIGNSKTTVDDDHERKGQRRRWYCRSRALALPVHDRPPLVQKLPRPSRIAQDYKPAVGKMRENEQSNSTLVTDSAITDLRVKMMRIKKCFLRHLLNTLFIYLLMYPILMSADAIISASG